MLITGGAGYIGSTVASACSDQNIEVVVLDNLVNGRAEFARHHEFVHGDIGDTRLLDETFGKHADIEVVVHCAALAVVPESVARPLDYYAENVSKTVSLLKFLGRTDCRRFLFSSSASVYKPSDVGRVDEHSAVLPASPYARSKAMVDNILADACEATDMRAISLRYFNPIGADPQLRSGMQVPAPANVVGRLVHAHRTGTPFTITGTTWPTRDGTGVRDYVHVWDLAQAHLQAIRSFEHATRSSRHAVINLGTGAGTTVRELHAAFERVVGGPVPYLEQEPRPGDALGCYTDSGRALELLAWKSELTLESGLETALAWDSIRDQVLAG